MGNYLGHSCRGLSRLECALWIGRILSRLIIENNYFRCPEIFTVWTIFGEPRLFLDVLANVDALVDIVRLAVSLFEFLKDD